MKHLLTILSLLLFVVFAFFHRGEQMSYGYAEIFASAKAPSTPVPCLPTSRSAVKEKQ